MPKKVEQVHYTTSTMTGLTQRFMGKGRGQDMEYEEESVHYALGIAQNAVVFIALKFEDNKLCIIIVAVVTLQPTAPSNPAANLLHTLLKAPNALAIK